MQQTKNRQVIEILLNHFFAIFKVSRPVASETRHETLDTETGKCGSRDSITASLDAESFRLRSQASKIDQANSFSKGKN